MTFQPPKSSDNPLNALYALNWERIVGDDFMSSDLLDKISRRAASDPEKLRRQLRELIDLYAIERTLSVMGFDPGAGYVIYDSIADTLRAIFKTHGCFILRLEASGAYQTPSVEAEADALSLRVLGSSLSSLMVDSGQALSSSQWPLPRNHPLASVLIRGFSQVVTACDNKSHQDVWQKLPHLEECSVKGYLAYPMREGNYLSGLILWVNQEPSEFSAEIQQLAQSSAELLSSAVELQRQIGQAQQLIAQPSPDYATLLSLRADLTDRIGEMAIRQQTFLNDLSLVVDTREECTRGHSQKVAHVARLLSEALHLNEKTVDLIYYAALLANLGKLQAPSHLLNKDTPLTPSEWLLLQEMPNAIVGMLMHIHCLGDVTPYVQFMRERWDGLGLPDGLKGQNIPLGSRILAVADAYVSMTEIRPYREQAMAHTEAMSQLELESGIKWDPMIVHLLASQPPADLLPALL
ncbi:MAG: HD domain-containing phosphohydrolase [Vampirovibrionales bacterium]|nr:HD domain-containing phosphohydrolase [Vampirovibrionales bacterium]